MRAEDEMREQDDDLALGALVRLRVVVAHAVVVLRVARVLEAVRARARRRCVTSSSLASWPGSWLLTRTSLRSRRLRR